jgi:hypothetical protein
MKRDDFGMRIDEVRELATKYSKQDLARMVKMGMLDPQRALMAGMMIDRIAKSAMQPPQTTVAEDVLAPEMPTTAQAGIMAAPGAPAPSPGVAGLPSGLQNMAGGGIVAFADGGTPEDMIRANREANAALAGMGRDDGLTLPGGFRTRELTLPERGTAAGEVQMGMEAEKAAGYDPEAMFRRMREEDASQKGDFAKRREEAKGEALLMAGLGLMGARRGQEFEVFSNASRQALMQYKSDLNDIRKSETDLRKAARELEMAEAAAKRSRSEKAQDRFARKEEQYNAALFERDKNYNQTVLKLADFIQDDKKVDRETATRMAIAELDSKTRKDIAVMQERGAAARASMPGSEEKIINSLLADLRKTRPEATLSDAMAIYRGLGKPQNTLSYEEALKLAMNDPLVPADKKAAKAIEYMNQDPMRSGVTGMAGSRPPTTFQLSPEAQKALQQYGGR